MDAARSQGKNFSQADKPRHQRGHGRAQTDRKDNHRAKRSERPRVSLPRVLAWEVLRDVEEQDSYANLLLPAKLARTRMAGQDAALTTEMTYGTLRAQSFYDAIISIAANRDAAEIEIPVRAAMRLGAHQLLGMRVADHAAVSETVGVIKAYADPKVAGFVNAVLRRIAERTREEWLELITANLSGDAAQALTSAHPAWIVRAFKQALKVHGRPATELTALLAADNAPARVCLAALPGLCQRSTLAEHVGTATELSPLGVYLEHGNPALVEEVAQGQARVQDEGSQLVALALLHAPLDESTGGDDFAQWLDLCAGPGGKTAVLAATGALGTQSVDAVDASAHRAELVEDSTRAIAEAVNVFHADGRHWGRDHPGQYTRVLVDVPCTGLGALRRRPEARWRRQPSDIGALGMIQADLLASAYRAVAPGGVVAYTTCSPHHAETVLIVEEFVRKHAPEVLNAPAVLAQITGKNEEFFASAQIGPGQVAQLWPHLHNTDGMFIALLRKPPVS